MMYVPVKKGNKYRSAIVNLKDGIICTTDFQIEFHILDLLIRENPLLFHHKPKPTPKICILKRSRFARC